MSALSTYSVITDENNLQQKLKRTLLYYQRRYRHWNTMKLDFKLKLQPNGNKIVWTRHHFTVPTYWQNEQTMLVYNDWCNVWLLEDYLWRMDEKIMEIMDYFN